MGPPDLVVEVLSPGNTKNEMKDKFQLYQNAGIPEYWVIEPEHEYILVYTLNDKGEYTGSPPLMEGDILKSMAFDGFELDVKKIFKTY